MSTESPVATPSKKAPRVSAKAAAAAAAAEALAASAPVLITPTPKKAKAAAAKGKKAKAAAEEDADDASDGGDDAATPADAVPKKARKASAAPKKRAASAAAASEDDADTAPAAPKKAITAVLKKRKVAAVSADDDVDTAAAPVAAPKKKKAAAAVVDDGTAAAAPAPKKPRKVVAKVEYIEAYGDWGVAEAERGFGEEDFAAWQEATIARAEQQPFKDWVRAKKAFYKGLKALMQARKKRPQKLVDSAATSENQLARLLSAPEAPTPPKDGEKIVNETVITAADWASLDGAYLAGHGFEGVFAAADIESAALPDKAVPIYTVYRAAVEKGLRPLGIVSENRKKDKATGIMEYVTNVPEKRVYVGIALPFQKLEASPFAKHNSDRAFLGEAPTA